MKNQIVRNQAFKALASYLFCCGLATPVLAQVVDETKGPKPPKVEILRPKIEILRVTIGSLEIATPAETERFLENLTRERERQRETEIWPLLDKLQSNSNRVQCAAAYLLGLGRYEEAVVSLAQKVALRYENPAQFHEWFGGIPDHHPAAVALANIGKPSIPFMIVNLESSDDEQVREWSARVIRQVEGAEVGAFILERAAAKQTDVAKKVRLQNAIEAFSKLKSGVHPEFEILFRQP